MAKLGRYTKENAQRAVVIKHDHVAKLTQVQCQHMLKVWHIKATIYLTAIARTRSRGPRSDRSSINAYSAFDSFEKCAHSSRLAWGACTLLGKCHMEKNNSPVDSKGYTLSLYTLETRLLPDVRLRGFPAINLYSTAACSSFGVLNVSPTATHVPPREAGGSRRGGR